MKIANDYISIISLIVSIILTVSIYSLSKKNHDNSKLIQTENQVKADARSKKYNTVTFASEHFLRVDNLVSELIELNRDLNNPTFEEIREDSELFGVVLKILNTYSSVGTAGKSELIDMKIVADMRRTSIKDTWTKYKNFIISYRSSSKDNHDAWIDFEWLATEMNQFETKEAGSRQGH
jgi:hypothetical protein